MSFDGFLPHCDGGDWMKMVRWRAYALFLFAALELALPSAPAEASPKALRASDIALALKKEDEHFRTRDPAKFSSQAVKALADTPSGREKRSLVTDVTLTGSPGTSELSRRVVVTRYEYATGL